MAPKELHYRDYNKFNAYDFKTELRQNLATSIIQQFRIYQNLAIRKILKNYS